MISDKLLAYRKRKTPKILVIGDLMLDHYIFGNASRLSPEAPVPVVNVKNESKIIGGAGNVANNIIALGGIVSVAGAIGDDENGESIKNIFSGNNIIHTSLITDKERCTTIKTRVLAANHQIVRIDREDAHDIDQETENTLLNSIQHTLKNDKIDIVILSDYNKGVLTYNLTQKIISYCNQLGINVIVDPKGTDYSKYKDAFVIKPNRKELAETSRMTNLNSHEKIKQAAAIIFKETETKNLVVTLSEEGMVIVTPNSYTTLPVKANEVYDVTGAGDTVIATMSYCLALGFSLEEACEIANFAAAIVVKHVGSATTTVEQIIDAIIKK